MHFRSIIYQVVACGRLKTKENFKLLALKVVAFAYERWSLTRGSKYSDLTWKMLRYFGKLVAEERWSLTRVGRNRRFDCICSHGNHTKLTGCKMHSKRLSQHSKVRNYRSNC